MTDTLDCRQSRRHLVPICAAKREQDHLIAATWRVASPLRACRLKLRPAVNLLRPNLVWRLASPTPFRPAKLRPMSHATRPRFELPRPICNYRQPEILKQGVLIFGEPHLLHRRLGALVLTNHTVNFLHQTRCRSANCLTSLLSEKVFDFADPVRGLACPPECSR